MPRHDRGERCDDQAVAVAAVVQRPAAGEVARRDQGAPLAIPHDERVVALEPLRTVASPCAVRVEDEVRRAVSAGRERPVRRRVAQSRGADRPCSRSTRRRRPAARRRPPRWAQGWTRPPTRSGRPPRRLPPPHALRCVRRRAATCRARRAGASRRRTVPRPPRRRSRSSARDVRGRRDVLPRARGEWPVSAVERGARVADLVPGAGGAPERRARAARADGVRAQRGRERTPTARGGDAGETRCHRSGNALSGPRRGEEQPELGQLVDELATRPRGSRPRPRRDTRSRSRRRSPRASDGREEAAPTPGRRPD